MMDTKKVLGGLLILIAVILILGLINVLDAGAIFSTYWPVMIILAGILQMINKNLLGGGIVLLFGVWFQLDKLGFDTIHYIWPLLILAIGVALILGRNFNQEANIIKAAASASNSFSAFGRAKRSFAIDAYKGGRITTLFGSSEIDLNQCLILDEEVHLEVNTFFGGCAVYMPKDWKVEISGFPIFGGNEEKGAKAVTDTSPRVTIHTLTAFAGLEIYYQ